MKRKVRNVLMWSYLFSISMTRMTPPKLATQSAKEQITSLFEAVFRFFRRRKRLLVGLNQQFDIRPLKSLKGKGKNVVHSSFLRF